MQYKTCCVCAVTKPTDDFHRDKTKKDGHCSTCKECAKERARAWNFANAERASESARQYYQQHKDSIIGRVRLYYAVNRDTILNRTRERNKENAEQLRLYRQATKEHRRQVFRNWWLKNRDRNRSPKRREYHRSYQSVYRHVRRARKLSLPNTFSADNWQRALGYFSNRCAVCERPLLGLFHTTNADHWIPLSDPACPGTIVTNMLPLCGGVDGCNQSKHSRNPQEWLESKFGKRKATRILERINAYFEWVAS